MIFNMQKIVKKNERLEKSKPRIGGAAFKGTKRRQVKQYGADTDIDTVKEIMGDQFHY